MAGRPKEFDRDQVLTEVMEVFWRKGYSATSLRDIEEATGVGRQSLYNEFTDKNQLFMAAIEHYDENVTKTAIATLTAEGSPTRNIRSWLRSLVATATREDRRGCMLTNATMCVEITDGTMREATASVTAKLEKAIQSAVRNAVSAGELPTDTHVPTMTAFLLSTAQGILVLGRMGKSKSKLWKVLDLSLSMFSGV